MLKQLTPRLVFAGLAAFAVSAMLFARVYLEEFLNLEACPLCMTQRAFVVLWGVIALIAAVHNPGHLGRTLYASLCGFAAFFGAAVAARHIWLQQLPEDQVPACGPTLDYMLENLPLSDTLNIILMGDGNCADTLWTFMGLSIPGQTFLVFCAALLICLWQAVRR
jgi:disulfide bond formation protein DsbB